MVFCINSQWRRMKSAISRRKEAFIEQEVATALRENRVVQLSKSRPVLRNRVVAWIKEVLGDPTVQRAMLSHWI